MEIKSVIYLVTVLSLYAQPGIRLYEEISIYHTVSIDIFFDL